jgi:site-specific DNA-methyltransferase (adenine-specific)
MSIQIIEGDNLEVLKTLDDKSFSLIYIDPPYNTGKTQKRGDLGYKDSFESYKDFIVPRIKEAHRILTDNGSLFIHLDWREVHYVKVWTDEIFGRDSFMNEIIWAYDYGGRSKTKWSAKHDNILWYAKDPENYTFHFDEMERIPYMAPGLVGKEKAERGKTLTDCYSDDTDVLTRQGWKRFSTVTLDDELASVSPENSLIYTKPTALHKRYHNGDMVKIKSKTVDLLVTTNHNMYVKKKHDDTYCFVRASDLDSSQYFNLLNKVCWVGKIQNTYYLPKDSSKKTKKFDNLNMIDWCEFLGWYIAEGNVTIRNVQRKKQNRRAEMKYETCIAQTKTDQRSRIEHLLNRLGFRWHYNGNSYIVSGKILASYLEKLGSSYGKHIPKEFLELDRPYLQALYNGLVGGDGCIVDGDENNQDQISYFTTSPVLADQVQELLFKLGYNSSITVTAPAPDRIYHRKVFHSNYPKYTVYRRVARESSIWRDRHLSVVKYEGYVYCATVEPYHTLVVRRNGHPVVCGNCWWHTIVPTNGKEKTGYPTQKPLGILRRIVNIHSSPGDKLLDFFAGSGSFGAAAEELGRDCCLIDSNPDAIAVMKKRFQQ